MRTPAHLLAILLALAPVAARGQSMAFHKTPTALAGPAGATALAVTRLRLCGGAACTGPFDVGSVLLGASPSAKSFQGGALGEIPFPYALPASATCFAVGHMVAVSSPLADAAFCNGSTGQADVKYLVGTPQEGSTSLGLVGENVTGIAVAWAALNGEWVLMLAGTQTVEGVDLGVSQTNPTTVSWPRSGSGPTLRIQGLRVSSQATDFGDHDDVAWARQGLSSLELFWLDDASAKTLTSAYFTPLHVPLPADANAAGGLDADGDGVADLWVSVGSGPARLLAFHNDGLPADLPGATSIDIGAQLELVDPRLVQQIAVSGAPALAVADAGQDEVVVVSTSPDGGLLTWRGPTGGRTVTNVWAENVTGGSGTDLVVAYDTGAIDVFPADYKPTLQWAAGMPPGSVPMGSASTFGISVTDLDGTVAKAELFIRGVADPIASVVGPSGQTPNTPVQLEVDAPVGALCGASPLTLIMRATDDSGGFNELQTPLSLGDVAPSAAITGAPGPIPVALTLGGTALSVEALGDDPCKREVAFSWSDQSVPAGAVSGPDEGAGNRGVHHLTLPEATYPGLLAAGAPAAGVTVVPRSPGGLAGAAASVALQIDASGLLRVEQTADHAQLVPGDLALLTIVVSNPLSVDLARVVVRDALEGLASDGAAIVSGAGLVASTVSPSAVEWTVDRLPAGGRVTIQVPVRRTLGQNAVGRALAFAEGGAALSRPGSLALDGARLPGCGCGEEGTAAPFAAALLALWMLRRRRTAA